MMVTGYDTSLPELDIQIGLCKHFSTCGEVTGVLIPGDRRTGGLHRFVLSNFPTLFSQVISLANSRLVFVDFLTAKLLLLLWEKAQQKRRENLVDVT